MTATKTQLVVRSLADLKRAINQEGVTIHVREHWQPRLVGTTRTPIKIQGNGYYFYGPNHATGELSRMWAETPKASQLRFNEDGSVTFYPAAEHQWTLVFEV